MPLTCAYVFRGVIWDGRRPLCVRGRRVPRAERSADRGGTGHGRARTSPRTATDQSTDGGGKGHGRDRQERLCGPIPRDSRPDLLLTCPDAMTGKVCRYPELLIRSLGISSRMQVPPRTRCTGQRRAAARAGRTGLEAARCHADDRLPGEDPVPGSEQCDGCLCRTLPGVDLLGRGTVAVPGDRAAAHRAGHGRAEFHRGGPVGPAPGHVSPVSSTRRWYEMAVAAPFSMAWREARGQAQAGEGQARSQLAAFRGELYTSQPRFQT